LEEPPVEEPPADDDTIPIIEDEKEGKGSYGALVGVIAILVLLLMIAGLGSAAVYIFYIIPKGVESDGIENEGS
jgi:hypothetical protein